MPSAATIAGSASGTANSRRISPRPGKCGCRDRARATKIAGATDKQRRQQRLPQREAHDAEEIGVEGGDSPVEVAHALDAEPGERAADQERDRRQRDDAGDDAGVATLTCMTDRRRPNAVCTL